MLQTVLFNNAHHYMLALTKSSSLTATYWQLLVTCFLKNYNYEKEHP